MSMSSRPANVRLFEIVDKHGRILLHTFDTRGHLRTFTVFNFRPFLYVLCPTEERDTLKEWLARRHKDVRSARVQRTALCGYQPSPTWLWRIDAPSRKKLDAVKRGLVNDGGATAFPVNRWDNAAAGGNDDDLPFRDVIVYDEIPWEQQLYHYFKLRPNQWFSAPSTAASSILRSPSDVACIQESLPSSHRRVAYYDIEADNFQSGEFPDAQVGDRVQSIGVIVRTVGGESVCRVYLAMQTLHLPLVMRSAGEPQAYPVDVRLFGSEVEMLRGFHSLIQEVGATIFVAHNGWGFDNKFLCRSWERCTGDHPSTFLRPLSPLQNPHVTYREREIRHQTFGARTIAECKAEACIFLDTEMYARKKLKLDCFKLNAVAEACELDVSKMDLTPRELFTAFRDGDESALHDVAAYCMRDVELVYKIAERLDMIGTMEAQSFVTNTQMPAYVYSGEQRLTFNLIAKRVLQEQLFINRDHLPPAPATYQGATVLTPTPGLYTGYTATLDFASLYPSIIIGFNLCHSTLLCKNGRLQTPRAAGVPEEDCKRVDLADGPVFFYQKRKGILPAILETLWVERKRAKREMKQCTDTFKRAMADNYQLACKLSMNAIYGFCGVTETQGALLACSHVAQATTCLGRWAIDQSKRIVESEYALVRPVPDQEQPAPRDPPLSSEAATRRTATEVWDIVDVEVPASSPIGCVMDLGGGARYVVDAAAAARGKVRLKVWKLRVVYGDTDSVFVQMFGCMEDQIECWAYASGVAERLSAFFPNPMEMEMESLLCPLLLSDKKKNYLGNIRKAPDDTERHFYSKGLKTVRRDVPAIVKRTLQGVAESVTPMPPFDRDSIHRNTIGLVQRGIDAILEAKTLEDFITTKTFKRPDRYAVTHPDGPQIPQVQAAIRFNAAIACGDLVEEPLQPGDHVPFIVAVRGAASDKVCMRALHVKHVRHQGLEPDRLHYLKACEKAIASVTQMIPEIDTRQMFALAQEQALALQSPMYARLGGGRLLTDFFRVPPPSSSLSSSSAASSLSSASASASVLCKPTSTTPPPKRARQTKLPATFFKRPRK